MRATVVAPSGLRLFSSINTLVKHIDWHKELVSAAYIVLGASIMSAGFSLFWVPHNISAGGVTGIALMVSTVTSLSLGLLYWLLNIPMLIIGFFYLGRWKFVGRTLFASTMYATIFDFQMAMWPKLLPAFPLSDDLLLNTIYGAVVMGLGFGPVLRAGATMGGTSVIGRVIQMKTGIPLSQVYFYTDGLTILASGLVFGYDIALYGYLGLFLNGMAADYSLEGASRARTVTIITDNLEEMKLMLMHKLGRTVTHWETVGGYSGQTKHAIMVTVYRPQVSNLKSIVAEVDPKAFVTIGVTQSVLGQGFEPIRARN